MKNLPCLPVLMNESMPFDIWNEPRNAIQRMGFEAEANLQSVESAWALVEALSRRGQKVAPVASLDADGDVVLTWHRGRLKGSAVIEGEKVSSIVSDGRRIAYLGSEQVINELTVDGADFTRFGGSEECTLANQLLPHNIYLTSTTSAVRYFSTYVPRPRERQQPFGISLCLPIQDSR